MIQVVAFFFTIVAAVIQFDPQLHPIPDYVTRYAPVMHLYSEERYLPGSIEDYVRYFGMASATTNYSTHLTLSGLYSEQKRIHDSEPDAEAVYLNPLQQWDGEPAWLTGHTPRLWDGYVDAPATLIVVDKPHLGVLDAFWFYFYPFNLGPFVMGHGPFGNHLGDWEHSLVRFNATTGEPLIVWMSAHGGGTAYRYESLEMDQAYPERPVLYAARGTHAQYVSVGAHSHDLPWHMLGDFTDRGALWDPANNFVAYTFDGVNTDTPIVHPSNGSEPGREHRWGDWLLYSGCWGNRQLPPEDPRQQWSPWQWRIIDGPLGPLAKNLGREVPCERHKWWNVLKSCRVRNRVTPGEGLDADLAPCAAILDAVPVAIRPLVRIVTAGGWLCFWLDRLFG